MKRVSGVAWCVAMLALIFGLYPSPRYRAIVVKAAEPACGVANGFVATPAPTGPSISATCQVLRTYIAAYNRQDLTGSLRILAPDIVIRDCDFTWHTFHDVEGRRAVTHWLRDRFAEHDQLNADVVVGGGIGDTPTPRVFALHGTRFNDSLAAQGMPAQDMSGSKGTVSTTGTLLSYYILSDYALCEANQPFSHAPSAKKTKTVVQTFVDAYNAHDEGRVVQSLTRSATFTDCDFRRHEIQTLRGEAAVRAGLRSRFKAGDVLGNPRITVGSGNHVTSAEIDAQRTNHYLSGARTVSLRVQLSGPEAAHIGSVMFSMPPRVAVTSSACGSDWSGTS